MLRYLNYFGIDLWRFQMLATLPFVVVAATAACILVNTAAVAAEGDHSLLHHTTAAGTKEDIADGASAATCTATADLTACIIKAVAYTLTCITAVVEDEELQKLVGTFAAVGRIAAVGHTVEASHTVGAWLLLVADSFIMVNFQNINFSNSSVMSAIKFSEVSHHLKVTTLGLSSSLA